MHDCMCIVRLMCEQQWHDDQKVFDPLIGAYLLDHRTDERWTRLHGLQDRDLVPL